MCVHAHVKIYTQDEKVLTYIPISDAQIVSVVPGDHQSLVQKVRVRAYMMYIYFV